MRQLYRRRRQQGSGAWRIPEFCGDSARATDRCSRGTSINGRSSSLTAIWQRALGNTYSPGGALLVIDVVPPAVAQGSSQSAKLKKIVRFNIDDRFDPMMPITRKVDDLRFLSLEASKVERVSSHDRFRQGRPGCRQCAIDDGRRRRGVGSVVGRETHDGAGDQGRPTQDQAGVFTWRNRDRTGQASRPRCDDGGS